MCFVVEYMRRPGLKASHSFCPLKMVFSWAASSFYEFDANMATKIDSMEKLPCLPGFCFGSSGILWKFDNFLVDSVKIKIIISNEKWAAFVCLVCFSVGK